MASQTTIDDTIAALLSMGFELKDAQDAVQCGKLLVQEAVDWLVSGKPGHERQAAAPTLKLNDNQNRAMLNLQPDRQAPFSSPLPLPSDMAATGECLSQQHEPNSSASDIDIQQQVVSRLHLSEARLAHKKNFEEKTRDEATKKARLEKIQSKKAHERILKEIAEDRKVNKMTRVYGPGTTATDNSSAASDNQPVPKKPNGALTQCTIQIRLPSGRQLRKKFERETTLGNVWSVVLEESGDETAGHIGFMQPFPRREFSAPEMNKTLEELGLMPSGSLVLKKGEVNIAPQPAPEENVMDADAAPEDMDMNAEAAPEEMDMDAEEEDFNAAGQQHVWGRGRVLEGGEEEGAEEDGNENNDDFDEDDEDDWPALQEPWQPWGDHGGAWMPGAFGQGGGGFQGPFFGNGQRLVPEGAPGADNHMHRPVGHLAAEAAQQRQAQVQVPVAVPAPSPSPLVTVDTLQKLCLKHVIDQLCCPTGQLYTLGRLPPNVSQRIIDHLLRAKLLEPKIMRMFIPCLLHKLILDTYTYTTNELLFSLRLHPTIRILSLHSCPLISDQGIKHIANLKNLKALNLGLCKQITNSSLVVIAGFRQLQYLNLEETGVTDSGVITYLSTAPCIRHLNLSRTAVTSLIFPYLKYLKQLELLYLEETKISSLEGMEELREVRNLNVANTAIPTETLCHLATHPSLCHLNLTNTHGINGDAALPYLAGLKLKALGLPDRHSLTSAGLSFITGFALHTLDLTNYIHVDDSGMEHVGKITSLEKLMLTNSKVTDEGVLQLHGLTQLKVLHLDRTAVSDSGIAVVRAFKALSELSLSTTNVTNQFLKEGVLHACVYLSKLNLSRTHVGDKGLVHLTLPCLTLLNLDCTRAHATVVDTIMLHCPSLRSIAMANLTPVLEEEEDDD